MRRHLGIAPGGAVIVEECEGELRLKPAAVLEVARYSDAQIAAWDCPVCFQPQNARTSFSACSSTDALPQG
jgi:hypothetical protein